MSLEKYTLQGYRFSLSCYRRFLRPAIASFIAIGTCAYGGPVLAASIADPNFSPGRSADRFARILSELTPDESGIVFIGDMAFDPDRIRTRGFAGRKWSNGRIPIAFHDNVSANNQRRFFKACLEWSKVSAAHCVRRTNEADYVRVESGSGNWSFIGRVGGMQRMQIASWGSPLVITHELGHALGLGHEQSRPDRSTFVTINTNNIVESAKRNFRIIPGMRTYTPYDFASIMHYGPYYFSKNGLPTIVAKREYEEEGRLMGNRRYLSTGDAEGMRMHYGAPVRAYPALSGVDGSLVDGRAAQLKVLSNEASDNRDRGTRSSDAFSGDRLLAKDRRYLKNLQEYPNLKVWGGVPVKPGSFSDVVGILSDISDDVLCTGTLIRRNAVLTAKHCVCDGVNDRILIGDHEESGTIIDVASVIPSAQQCHVPVTEDDLDLGLLILAGKVTDFAPRTLATDDEIDDAKRYEVVGFGYADNPDGSVTIGQKRQTGVPAASNACDGVYPGTSQADAEVYGCKPRVEIVAGQAGLGRDTCNGDSGGPLFSDPDDRAVLNEDDSLFKLAGVTSRATWQNHGDILCGDGGIYVRITPSVKQWIADNLPSQAVRN